MSSNADIGHLYAAAIFELARDAQAVDAVRDDLLAMAQLATEVTEFLDVSVSPYFSKEYKGQLLQKLFAGKVATLTMDFLQVVNRHNRMAHLSLIAHEYEKLRDVYFGCSLVEVTLAAHIDAAQVAKLADEIKAAFKSEIKLAVRIDPSIIGGIILRRGDMIVDNTVRRELREAVSAITSSRKTG